MRIKAMQLRQTLSLVLSLAIAVNPALAATPNIIRLGAPVSMPPPPTENWVATDPEYSDWETGAPYGCSTWTPSPAGYSESTQFVQTADDCEADASRTRQEREFDTVSESYRYVGEPVTEEVTYVNQTASRDYRIAYTVWENASDFYGCTNWTPAPEGYPIGTSFTQTATDCSVDQTQTRTEHSRLTGFDWVSEASLSYERTLANQTSQRQAEGAADLPTIALNAPGTAVFAGEAFVLNWSAQNAASVTLKGDVADSGLATSDFTVTGSTYEVTPAAPGTYRYTATATNSANQSITAHKDVTAVSGPTISSFTTDRQSLASGGTITFNWEASSFDALEIDNGIGSVSNTSKSITVDGITGGRTYTLTATKTLNGVTRTALKNVTFTVIAAPTVSITTAPSTSVFANAAFNLGWSGTDAINYKIRGNIAASGVSTVDVDLGMTASRTITPSAPGSYVYTITATNSVGVTSTVNRTVTVVADPVVNSFTANPTSVATGGKTTLSWSATGAAVNIDQGVGTVYGSSVEVLVGPTAGSKNYTLTTSTTLNGITRSATRSAVVNVIAAPTVAITSSPSTSVFVNEPFTLGWSGTNATSYDIRASSAASGVATTDISKGTSTSHSITPISAGTYTYTVTARNALGVTSTTSRSVTVEAAPTLTAFSASPTSVTAGGNTTLSWSGSGYSSLSINQSVGSVTGTNSKLVAVGTTVGTKTYTLTASATLNGITKTATRTASVNVTAAATYVYNSQNKAACEAGFQVGPNLLWGKFITWNGASIVISSASPALNDYQCSLITGSILNTASGQFKLGAVKYNSGTRLEFEIMKL